MELWRHWGWWWFGKRRRLRKVWKAEDEGSVCWWERWTWRRVLRSWAQSETEMRVGWFWRRWRDQRELGVLHYGFFCGDQGAGQKAWTRHQRCRICVRLGAMRDVASDAVARVSDRVCVFFFFSRICADSAWFAPMRLNSCRIGFDLCRTGLIRPKSGRIGHIRSYRLAADTAEIGRNMPEMVEIDLEYGRKIWNLHSSFFFCESRHSMCFLKIF